MIEVMEQRSDKQVSHLARSEPVLIVAACLVTLLCDARISVFHVSDGAAKNSAQTWLIRGGLVDLKVSNVTKFTKFEIIA